MKAGAVEFLTKPFRDQDMLDAVQVAFTLGQARRERDKTASNLKVSFESLTAREQEIMALERDEVRLNRSGIPKSVVI